MRAKSVNQYNVQSISFTSEALLTQAKARAKSLGISFSSYVSQLIRNDLDDGGDFPIRALPQSAPSQLNDSSAPPDSPDQIANLAARRAVSGPLDPAPGRHPKPRKQ